MLPVNSCYGNTPEAYPDPEAESRKVEVTLRDGSKVTGYVKEPVTRHISTDLFGNPSLSGSVKISQSPYSDDCMTYNCNQAVGYRYMMPVEGYPDGVCFDACTYPSPQLFGHDKLREAFIQRVAKNDDGAVYKWHTYVDKGGNNSDNVLVDVYGVKFPKANAAYPIVQDGAVEMGALLKYLKKVDPELCQRLNQYYFKGKSAKIHRRELVANPGSILEI